MKLPPQKNLKQTKQKIVNVKETLLKMVLTEQKGVGNIKQDGM